MRRLPELQRDWGITAVRVAMGIIILSAGYQKIAGGIGTVATGFAKIPVPLPWLMAPVISWLELLGGALLIIGLGVRWLGLVFALEHIVTTFWVQLRLRGWPNGRLELMLLAAGLMLFLAGPGRMALDTARGASGSPWRPWR